MVDQVLAEGTIAFQVQGRLLQELGERLVASAEVALVELIKNAYDADASSCEVRVENAGKVLVIQDTGHGMTFDEFATKWMRIATYNKVADRLSRRYKRRLTGAKGIGRFAVRYLGSQLTLVTIADDSKQKARTKLTATFDWPQIDKLGDLSNAEIDYKLERADAEPVTGTTLQITKLKTAADFARASTLRADVLKIVTPLQGLDPGRFKPSDQSHTSDPGFVVKLPGESENTDRDVNLAEMVLANYWARLVIDLQKNVLTFKVFFPPSGRKPKILETQVSTALSAGFVADIRYFPRRKGIFQKKGIKGQVAWEWVRSNHGVAVVDHGFRVVPYGYESDDWLQLDFDKTHHRRDWRSEIAQAEFPISDRIRNKPDENPTFYIPNNLQVVGAVFVESHPIGAKHDDDLTPSMDREGFLKNRALDELADFVRAGLEFLALHDKRELDRLLAAEAREQTAGAKEEIRAAIRYIKKSRTLTAGDKARITKAYMALATRVEEVEEYSEQARRNITTMSLLGVVAGFMTHETNSLMFEMEKAVKQITALANKHASLREMATTLSDRLSSFKNQIEYAQMFVKGVRRDEAIEMSAGGQIRVVLRRFQSFAVDHRIDVTNETPSNCKTPALPPAVYSGVILNLYTNALKAVLSAASSIREPKVALKAWNEDNKHILEVCDNGVGIPPQLRKRIWDPLYTTTSNIGSPLGSGMGLGLSLVRHVVQDIGGKIELRDKPAEGFTTCFRVTFPLN